MIVEGLHTFMSTMNLKILLAAGCVEGKVLNRTKDLVFIFQYVIGQNLGTESPFIHAITWKHPIKSATLLRPLSSACRATGSCNGHGDSHEKEHQACSKEVRQETSKVVPPGGPISWRKLEANWWPKSQRYPQNESFVSEWLAQNWEIVNSDFFQD